MQDLERIQRRTSEAKSGKDLARAYRGDKIHPDALVGPANMSGCRWIDTTHCLH